MAELRAETRFAKTLFLFGNGDGKPVRNAGKLAALAGVHRNTIDRHIASWEKEAEALLVNSSEMGLALSLSSEDISSHSLDMSHLRRLLDSNKTEQGRIDAITSKLESWMEKFDSENVQEALKILDLWVKTCGQKNSMSNQFLSLQKQWTSLSGIVDLKDISVSREKEVAKGKARLEVKALEAETGAAPIRVAGGIFARPVAIELED